MPEEGLILKRELRKMDTVALECIVGAYWGVQTCALDVLIERDVLIPSIPHAPEDRTNTGAERSNICQIYVRRPDIAP